MLKNIVSFSFQLALALVILYIVYRLFSYLSYNKDWENVDETWVEVIGTLQKTSNGIKFHHEVFSYEYGGKFYTEEDYISFSVIGNVVNEKYIIKVNSKKPDHYSVVGWKPVFTKDEMTKVGVCKITSIIKKANPLVLFEYSVNGVSYKRGQFLPDLTYSELKEGSLYEVEYWVDNPQRAIIHIDKPKYISNN